MLPWLGGVTCGCLFESVPTVRLNVPSIWLALLLARCLSLSLPPWYLMQFLRVLPNPLKRHLKLPLTEAEGVVIVLSDEMLKRYPSYPLRLLQLVIEVNLSGAFPPQPG